MVILQLFIIIQFKFRQFITHVLQHVDNWQITTIEYTCVAPCASKPTRREYVFADPVALSLASDIQIFHEEVYKAHSVLQLKVTAAPIRKQHNHSYPDNLAVAFDGVDLFAERLLVLAGLRVDRRLLCGVRRLCSRRAQRRR